MSSLFYRVSQKNHKLNNHKSDYENAVVLPSNQVIPLVSASPPASPHSLKSPDAYTEVSAPLPGHLRNDDMLMVKEVPADTEVHPVAPAPTRNSNFSTTPVTSPQHHVVGKPGRVQGVETYSNPLDALSHKVKPPVKSSEHAINRVSASENYSNVADALPEGEFARMGVRRSLPEVTSRSRTASDCSPLMTRSVDTTRSAEDTPNTPSHRPFHKTQSLHRKPDRKASRKKSNAKEVVEFSPKTGFKIKQDCRTSHDYALIDATFKKLPPGDETRREGFGTPEHVSVSLTQ